ncbi:MAG TPA: hypothetical protein DEP53_14605 [Bacteroidetes bacterium]|nr:hypothetical protein [Bacteroidota bacterium]
MKNIVVTLALVMGLAAPVVSQVQLGGEASAYALKTSRSQNPRVVNRGTATFGWRLDLFLDAKVTDNVFVLANTRSFEDDPMSVDYAAVRIIDLAGLGIDFQIGKFDMPFGNLAERRFPARNFLYGLPLIYEYRMSLTNQVAGRLDVLNNRGKGVGLRLLDLGIYDIGAMLYGDIGPFHYAVAGSNGTISSTGFRQLNQNADFNKIVRLAFTPMMGLTIGASAAMGAYLGDGGKPLPRAETSDHYQQRIGEADIEFSRDRFLLNGEIVYSQWTVPFEDDDTKLSVVGYYAETKYTWVPRFYTAVRVGGLLFSKVQLGSATLRWDHDVFEVEAGIGYHLERNTLLKIVRRETMTPEVTGTHDNLTVLQLAVSF